jgi:hypothetical protein
MKSTAVFGVRRHEAGASLQFSIRCGQRRHDLEEGVGRIKPFSRSLP